MIFKCVTKSVKLRLEKKTFLILFLNLKWKISMRNMIFKCVTKRQVCIFLTETMANASDNSRLLNSRNKEIVYSVSEYFLRNKEDSRKYLERPAEATGVSKTTVARIRRE